MGVFHTAMAKLPHYFTPFQTFVMAEAERDTGRFDMLLALTILREAKYRADGATAQGVFLYEFESPGAIAWGTIAGWRPWPAIRSSTTPGSSGS